MKQINKFYNKNKTLVNFLIFTAVLVALYLFFKEEIDAIFKRKLGKDYSTGLPSPENLDKSKVLKKGVSGYEVTELQQTLIANGYDLPRFGADGVFGTETENALMQWTLENLGDAKSEITLMELETALAG